MLYLLMGCPGAGKSTWILNHTNPATDDVIISRDAIRFGMLGDSEDYFSHEKQVFEEYVKQIKIALNEGKTVFADATHLTPGSRKKTLCGVGDILKFHDVGVIWIKEDLETCLKRNEQRDGRALVPREQVEKMYRSIVAPKWEEGFNKIFIVEKGKIKEIVKA